MNTHTHTCVCLRRNRLGIAGVGALCAFVIIIAFEQPTLLSLEATYRSWRTHINPTISSPRIVILTVWSHYPEMMPWQVASLRAFLKTNSMLYLAMLNSPDETINTGLTAMASSLNIKSARVKEHPAGPSNTHAHALNDGMRILKQNYNLTRKDILFLLDSDMFLVSPLDLPLELGTFHAWSVLQQRSNITYLWPNFTVLYFSNLSNGDEILQSMDWRHCQGYRGVIFDSGGCTAKVLDGHPEIRLKPATSSCDAGKNDSSSSRVCRFMRTQNAHLPDKCTNAYTIEAVGNGKDEARCHGANPCESHGMVYHLGSAGSNWRGCSEVWLATRRTAFFNFLGRQIAAAAMGIEFGDDIN